MMPLIWSEDNLSTNAESDKKGMSWLVLQGGLNETHLSRVVVGDIKFLPTSWQRTFPVGGPLFYTLFFRFGRYVFLK